MATLGEMLHAVSVEYTVVAGAAGISREVRRIVHGRHSADLSSPIGQGDLVIYPEAESGTDQPPNGTRDRPLATLLGAGVSGVFVDVPPRSAVSAAANASNTPLILIPGGSLTQALASALEQTILVQDSRLPQLQASLQQELSDLARAGADQEMLLERLVEITGKTGLLQTRTQLAGDIRTSARQDIDTAILHAAITASDDRVQRWIRDTADATVANIFRMEIPPHGLVRLVAPIWIDGWMHAALSLFARAWELTTRDRVALLAAARTIASFTPTVRPELPGMFDERRCSPVGTIAISAPRYSPDALAELITNMVDLQTGGLTIGDSDVRAWLLCPSADDWNKCVHDWHARLTNVLGSAAIGHSFQRCRTRQMVAAAMIHAAEARLIGSRLFGPSHVTSFADAQLARVMLQPTDAADLGALFERAVRDLVVEDRRRDDGLVRTLEVYCETFGTTRTAERLGVHRNTVLYRLKQIEEITATDLEDASTRLIFQLGLKADRLLRRMDARGSASTGLLAAGASVIAPAAAGG